MRRIQVVIDAELDERLEREAFARRLSKSALVREYVDAGLPPGAFSNGLMEMPILDAGEPSDSTHHDDVIYG
ncbi:MAG: CopG family transcriptional regulator [Gaiellales bacterium]